MPDSSSSARKPATSEVDADTTDNPVAGYLDEILTRLADGNSLRSICRDLGIPESNARYWLKANEESRARYADAKEMGCDALAEECIEIADTPLIGEIRTRKPIVIDGKAVEGAFTEELRTEDMLGHRKLQIDTRMRLIGKWSPRYSEKLAHTGPDGGHIKFERVERVIVDPTDPDR